jgi:hypothetical protein
MNPRIALVAAAMLSGCASSGNQATSQQPEAPMLGDYQYTASVPGMPLQGKLVALTDTILIIPDDGYCRPVSGSQQSFRYVCDGAGRLAGFSLTLDRWNPVQFSKWGASVRVQKSRRVCAVYELRSGQQVCVRFTTEYYEVTESTSGPLQVIRAP